MNRDTDLAHQGSNSMDGRCVMVRHHSTFIVTHAFGLEWRICIDGPLLQILEALIQAGDRGITASETSKWMLSPSPCVDILRKKHGLDIKTVKPVRENHEGEWPTTSWRHFLRSNVRRLDPFNSTKFPIAQPEQLASSEPIEKENTAK